MSYEMKKNYVISTIILVFGLLLMIGLFNKNEVSNAQTTDEEYNKLLERDKNVPQEKVNKAFEEARKIKESLIKVIAEKKPKFMLVHDREKYIISHVPGQKGLAGNELTWREGKKTEVSFSIVLDFNKVEVKKSFDIGLSSISIGDFYKLSGIGDEAILAKNFTANTKMTGVNMHFIKGRAEVHISLTNHKRSTEKNEKELMEFVKLIEPLIIARDNFDD
jgi:hypothetical protein